MCISDILKEVMNEYIKSDLYRYGRLSGIKGILKGRFIPGFRYMYFFRKAQRTKYKLVKLYYRLRLRLYSIKYGFQIPYNTKIGYGFYIGHCGRIIINPKTIIGNNCNIATGVTIGQTNRGKKKGTPVISDNVWIGTGAILVGKIHIGKNVLIAPNSFVNIDIPDNSLVIGNPARVIFKENATDGYINNVYVEKEENSSY